MDITIERNVMLRNVRETDNTSNRNLQGQTLQLGGMYRGRTLQVRGMYSGQGLHVRGIGEDITSERIVQGTDKQTLQVEGIVVV